MEEAQELTPAQRESVDCLIRRQGELTTAALAFLSDEQQQLLAHKPLDLECEHEGLLITIQNSIEGKREVRNRIVLQIWEGKHKVFDHRWAEDYEGIYGDSSVDCYSPGGWEYELIFEGNVRKYREYH